MELFRHTRFEKIIPSEILVSAVSCITGNSLRLKLGIVITQVHSKNGASIKSLELPPVEFLRGNSIRMFLRSPPKSKLEERMLL